MNPDLYLDYEQWMQTWQRKTKERDGWHSGIWQINVPPYAKSADDSPDFTDDDLYKIGYMDGKVGKPMSDEHKGDEAYKVGYNDGKADNDREE